MAEKWISPVRVFIVSSKMMVFRRAGLLASLLDWAYIQKISMKNGNAPWMIQWTIDTRTNDKWRLNELKHNWRANSFHSISATCRGCFATLASLKIWYSAREVKVWLYSCLGVIKVYMLILLSLKENPSIHDDSKKNIFPGIMKKPCFLED